MMHRLRRYDAFALQISDAFLDEKIFGNLQEILQNLLCFSEKYVIIG